MSATCLSSPEKRRRRGNAAGAGGRMHHDPRSSRFPPRRTLFREAERRKMDELVAGFGGVSVGAEQWEKAAAEQEQERERQAGRQN
ncbi:hypothetical protein EDC01DRAFT_776438 [Geopyxis carbonaria]|nr:hypothetical protein EDC01DRAFT_776438 [Geopyxis carbonaria]